MGVGVSVRKASEVWSSALFFSTFSNFLFHHQHHLSHCLLAAGKIISMWASIDKSESVCVCVCVLHTKSSECCLIRIKCPYFAHSLDEHVHNRNCVRMSIWHEAKRLSQKHSHSLHLLSKNFPFSHSVLFFYPFRLLTHSVYFISHKHFCSRLIFSFQFVVFSPLYTLYNIQHTPTYRQCAAAAAAATACIPNVASFSAMAKARALNEKPYFPAFRLN